MECNTLECHSEAVAETSDGYRKLCTECALRVMRQWGPKGVSTIPGKLFPWEYVTDGSCPHCGVEFNKYLISVTGGCPKCHKTLPGMK